LHSISFHAAPIPRISRPFEMWSTVAAMLASTAGCRYGMAVTWQPILIREVSAAMADSMVQPSKFGPCRSPVSG
jgi:hypothetical protein